MSSLLKAIKKLEPSKDNKFLHTLFDGFFTFAFTPNETTKNGTHIKDGMDLKRTMVHVVIAMQLCYIFGTYNIGQQHFAAIGEYTGFFEGFHLKLVHGLIKLIPLFVVTHLVGLGIEFFYAAKKGHPIEEGFLVTGALIPLIMPPDLPLWILALAVAFAVILGKEAFGGTGMNIWNVALLARVFIFFAYPTTISGDDVWVSGLVKEGLDYGIHYGWAHDVFNSLFNVFGWATFADPTTLSVVDGFTGATPLSLANQGGWAAVTEVYSPQQMLWGNIPGSIGESCKPFVIFGAIFLIVTKIASWRVMVSMFLGCAVTGILFNAWGVTEYMNIPWYYHFYMGSFLFAMAFMATDPVTAASTNTGKWIYGFFAGSVGLIIRVINPAYPEGWMLSILFMNTFAPTIDFYVLDANMKRRAKRAKKASLPQVA